MKRHALTAAACIALTGLSGCATTGNQTAMQRAQGQCGAALVIGLIGGAIIGNNTGDGDAGEGAAAGVGLGVGVCAVLMAMASAEDQARIAELERQALESGQERTQAYVGQDGLQRSILVRTSTVSDPTWSGASNPAMAQASPRICRTRQTTLNVEGKGEAALQQDIYCRNPETAAWELQSA